MRILTAAFLASLLVVGSNAVSAAPNAPPPPGAVEHFSKVMIAPNEASVRTYLENFVENVRVWENDKEVATGRVAYQDYLLNRAGLNYTVVNVSYDNPLIVAEAVNNFAPFRAGVVQDCCFWARVASYHYQSYGGLVDEVRYIENRSPWSHRDRPR